MARRFLDGLGVVQINHAAGPRERPARELRLIACSEPEGVAVLLSPGLGHHHDRLVVIKPVEQARTDGATARAFGRRGSTFCVSHLKPSSEVRGPAGVRAPAGPLRFWVFEHPENEGREVRTVPHRAVGRTAVALLDGASLNDVKC